MKLDRVRTAALAATAVLAIGGASTALAQSPKPNTQAPVAAPVGPSSATAGAAQGDQTAPDVGSAETTAEPPGTTVESPAGGEAASTEADGPAGHQDAAGQNVDHQFQGEE